MASRSNRIREWRLRHSVPVRSAVQWRRKESQVALGQGNSVVVPFRGIPRSITGVAISVAVYLSCFQAANAFIGPQRETGAGATYWRSHSVIVATVERIVSANNCETIELVPRATITGSFDAGTTAIVKAALPPADVFDTGPPDLSRGSRVIVLLEHHDDGSFSISSKAIVFLPRPYTAIQRLTDFSDKKVETVLRNVQELRKSAQPQVKPMWIPADSQ